MSDYSDGYRHGWRDAMEIYGTSVEQAGLRFTDDFSVSKGAQRQFLTSKKKRKLSAWQKFVKVNSKKPRFRFKSGSKKGKINLKALGVAYRKTPAGKKRR